MPQIYRAAPSFLGETVSDGLHRRGWWVRRNYFDAALITQLADELQALRVNGALQAAGIGRDKKHQIDTSIRSDAIRWLSRETAPQCRYLNCMEELRQEINRELFLGLFEYEAHYAYYEPGAFYIKHRDSFRGAANRVVSVVTYLNRNWPEDGGGELSIYDPESSATVYKVAPEAGTLAVFLSEQIAHEVAPARLPRLSIAGWFRVNSSSQRQSNPPL